MSACCVFWHGANECRCRSVHADRRSFRVRPSFLPSYSTPSHCPAAHACGCRAGVVPRRRATTREDCGCSVGQCVTVSQCGGNRVALRAPGSSCVAGAGVLGNADCMYGRGTDAKGVHDAAIVCRLSAESLHRQQKICNFAWTELGRTLDSAHDCWCFRHLLNDSDEPVTMV